MLQISTSGNLCVKVNIGDRMKHFNGMLTIENIEEVANMIVDILHDKQYVFVSANEFFDYKPDVRVNQKLKQDALSVWIEDGYAGFNICDSYGVWGLSAMQKGYNASFDAPYVEIEYNTIKITHKAGSGNKIYWVITAQES